MKSYYASRISENIIKDNIGQLICLGVPIARTGKQTYTEKELEISNDEKKLIDVDRPIEEVMSKTTLSSFEGKPLTLGHPEEDVSVENMKRLAVGFAQNVRQGKNDKGEDVILADLVFNKPDVIKKIEDKEIREISCGYNCEIDSEKLTQTNIIGNHIALVENGRAGNAVIRDEAIKDVYKSDNKLRLKDVKRGWAIVAQNYYNKYFENSLVDEVVTGSLEEAKRVRDSYSRAYGLIYLIFDRNRIKDSKEEIMEDAGKLSFKLTKKRNEYDEFVVQAYVNGNKNEAKTYYTDDWDDALSTLKRLAKDSDLKYRQQGSVHIVDSKLEMEDGLTEVPTNLQNEIINKLKNIGLGVTAKGRTLTGRFHMRVKSFKPLKYGEEIKQTVKQIEEIDKWLKTKGTNLTYNVVFEEDTLYVLGSIDVDKIYVKDSKVNDTVKGYVFPNLTSQDLTKAKSFGLTVGKKNRDGVTLLGNLNQLKKFASDWLDYELVEDYYVEDSCVKDSLKRFKVYKDNKTYIIKAKDAKSAVEILCKL